MALRRQQPDVLLLLLLLLQALPLVASAWLKLTVRWPWL
jgi:hypothetical protein